jgi:starch synthase
VRAAGGLDDTIDNFDRETMGGNGFKFYEYNAERLLEKIREALLVYDEPDLWRKLTLNGMHGDYSWTESARHYVDLYQRLAGIADSATV